jgi:hypothetical protein
VKKPMKYTASVIRAMMVWSPDNGGSKPLWNVGQFIQDYTAQKPRRRSSSQDSWFPGRDSNRRSPKYEALATSGRVFVTFISLRLIRSVICFAFQNVFSHSASHLSTSAAWETMTRNIKNFHLCIWICIWIFLKET